ncbi:hypothetical protein L226DRAFT_571451 [Lentinus tigrinus ALCF2SS1-7]|uniref:RNI-like protein n=1 Tax=Lentinus tigrinus ALCF2SS1-6 TaxID=1328759 RepID=A0A5C2SFY2_9APHY|nr:hypothetical protein L227DRAFT_609935 [Lentinus tigrinus ALCF2SS1-6]RPD74577.1 hypothetical protein L226DRAFT_571451 [Lentinus tigrinus ALCF2SS1-7]
MGQRHQVFLIARVRPHGAPADHPGNRRCIAAFHHQWCYGSLPLRAMRRLVTLIQQPDNATIVRAEVRDIQGKYGSYGAEGPCIPDVPCPFTTSLLAMAWTADIEDGANIQSSGTSLENDILPASMGCWDGDNNDGLSILDVTDPEKPAYCFLSGPESPGSRAQYLAPLDGRSYLSIYYALPKNVALDAQTQEPAKAERERKQQEYWLECIQGLADVPVLPPNLLREAWPGETFKDPPQSSAPPQESRAEPEVSDGMVANLADLSLNVAVKQSIEDEDTTEVEKLLWLPGKAARVKTLLRDLDPFRGGAVGLLVMTLKELKETSRVNLAGFRLSGAHVSAVLADLGDVRSVDLSDNTVITADDVPEILAATPTLRRIVLMGCPSIDGTRLLELVRTQPFRFKTVEGILHPAFLSIQKPDPYPCSFTYVSMMSTHSLSCVSLPFFTPSQVVQALADIIPWQAGTRSATMAGQYALPCVGTSAFQGGTRDPGQSISERTVMTVPLQSPRIPRGQKELWTFVCNMPQYAFLDPANKGWGFVHYTHEETTSETEDATQPVDYPDLGSGKVYDLKGFLACMAKEGRPMPSDEAVEKLEKILYLKDTAVTDEYCCPLLKQEAVSKIDPDGRRGSLRYQGFFSL